MNNIPEADPELPVEFSEHDIIASLARESFYEFVKQFWDTIIPDSPVWNWHIRYLCNELQKVAERVFRGQKKEYDLIINISPGSTKSTIASVMFLPWCWIHMPTMRMIGVSYTDDLAMDLSTKSRDIVQSDRYKLCFPEIQPSRTQWTKSHWMNTARGARISAGTGGTITGKHAHIITVDDPLNPEEAMSEVELKTANRYLSDTLSSRKVDKEVTPTILIMQRLHQDDPTANMINKSKQMQKDDPTIGKIKHICLPAEITNDVKPKGLRKYYVNGLMDVKRLNKKVLKEYQVNMGQYGYAGQMLQSPIPAGGGMFKTARIRIAIPDDKWVSLVRYWDKAGTQDGGAFTVGVLMGRDRKGRYWVLDIKREQLSSEERESLIKQTAEIDGKNVLIGIEQEPGSGGKESAENTVKNLAGYRVFVERPTGDKVYRADPYSVQVNYSNVYMVKGEWNENYLNELKFFPNSKYKDQVDASSGSFNKLSKDAVRVGAM